MAFYKSAMDDVSHSVHGMYVDCRGLRQIALQKPSNLVADIDDQVYHRLAVAWGLSFPKADIGDVTRPSEIPDVEPREKINPYEGFISKDMV